MRNGRTGMRMKEMQSMSKSSTFAWYINLLLIKIACDRWQVVGGYL